MIFSMTGFGRAQGQLGGVDVALEITSVNRRNLETSFSLPRDWQGLEREFLTLIRDRIQRGKVHVALHTMQGAAATGFIWDEAGLDSSLQRLQAAAARNQIEWKPDADALVRIAALNKVEAVLPAAEDVVEAVSQLLLSALEQMMNMRAAEGAVLAQDLSSRLDLLVALLGELKLCSQATVPRFREQLMLRLGQAQLEIDLSDERVLKEIAIYADKSDISEEVTRLESHFEQFRACLQAGSPVGRKLEFILQEVNREFNTIGSKANNVDASRHVIEAKNEVERIREQIQNIE